MKMLYSYLVFRETLLNIPQPTSSELYLYVQNTSHFLLSCLHFLLHQKNMMNGLKLLEWPIWMINCIINLQTVNFKNLIIYSGSKYNIHIMAQILIFQLL